MLLLLKGPSGENFLLESDTILDVVDLSENTIKGMEFIKKPEKLTGIRLKPEYIDKTINDNRNDYKMMLGFDRFCINDAAFIFNEVEFRTQERFKGVGRMYREVN